MARGKVFQTEPRCSVGIASVGLDSWIAPKAHAARGHPGGLVVRGVAWLAQDCQ